MKTKVCVFWLLGLLLITLLASPAMAQTPITGPIVITTPGDYVLQNDIIDSTATKVIEIKCSDVSFDGNGFTIDGLSTTSTYGIYVYSGATSISRNNVTVKNVKTREFGAGIFARNISELVVKNCIIGQNLNYGINFRNISKGKFYNNKLNNTANSVFYETITIAWNITPASGPNIVGGPSIGGNYWGSPTLTGFSDTAADANLDGFADSPYTIATGKIDLLPLVKPSGPPPLTADFVADTTVGNVQMEVHFTDLTQGDPTGWHWNFGDGILVDDIQDPVHTYVASGVYTVTLTAVRAEIGIPPVINNAVKSDYIFVKGPFPVADFDIDQSSTELPSKVFFTDTSTGEVVHAHWEFGDGGWTDRDYWWWVEGQPDPSQMTVGHTYVNPGTYTVNLTVWNSWGDHSHSLQDVVVTRPAVSKVFICCPDVTNIELGSEKPYYTNLRLALSPDDEPRGFSGYTVNLDINSESQWYPAKFTSATFPQWAVINEMDPPYYPGSPDWPTRTLDLKAADLNNQVGPGQWNIQLAELSINAERVGSAEIWPMVEKLNDEAGGDLVADVVPGEVHVYANVQPFYGCSESPMDLDGDSLFEDINGNGAWDYADVALYFQQMEQIHYFETIRYFDYNLNGRIDFADVIVLFHMQ